MYEQIGKFINTKPIFTMEHFKQELIDYLDYYSNRRIKAALKGLLPANHRQQTFSSAQTNSHWSIV